MRISRPAGQSVPSVASCKLAIGGLEDRKMVGTRTSNLLHRITNPLIICCLVTFGLCVHTAAALPGSGIQQDPWRIESLADFDVFAADPNYWSGFTRLETDVNLAGRTYTTAVIAPDTNSSGGFQGTAFTGVFDGNDHKIVWLTIDDVGANDCLGLFGFIREDGQVSNLGLEGVSVSGTGWFVGGLVGTNSGNVSNCYSTGSVSGVHFIGGLVGYNVGSISNCYSTGNVSGVSFVGGLVGGNDVSSLNVGTISNCYSTGSVSGGDYVGGLVGGNNGSVSNCYSTGDVSGDYVVGGLVGANVGLMSLFGSISNCYSTGDVNGVDYVGGLLGHNMNIISNSFWDTDTQIHGVTESIGLNGGIVTNVEGLHTAEMKTMSTFTDAVWDFAEIWGIGEHQTYPFLRTEPSGDSNHDGKVDLIDLAILASHWLEEN